MEEEAGEQVGVRWMHQIFDTVRLGNLDEESYSGDPFFRDSIHELDTLRGWMLHSKISTLNRLCCCPLHVAPSGISALTRFMRIPMDIESIYTIEK